MENFYKEITWDGKQYIFIKKLLGMVNNTFLEKIFTTQEV